MRSQEKRSSRSGEEESKGNALSEQSVILEEWKDLRGEIVRKQQFTERITIGALVINFTIYSFVFRYMPVFALYLFLLPCLISGLVHYWICVHRFSVTRIATYIKNNLEPNLMGLNWETQLAHQKKRTRADSSLRAAFFDWIHRITTKVSPHTFLLASFHLFWLLCCAFYLACPNDFINSLLDHDSGRLSSYETISDSWLSAFVIWLMIVICHTFFVVPRLWAIDNYDAPTKTPDEFTHLLPGIRAYLKTFPIEETDLQVQIREKARALKREHWLVPNDVAKFLYVLTRITRAESVYEVGSFLGYSTLWFAAALPRHGKVVYNEKSPESFTDATALLKTSTLKSRIEMNQGDAVKRLETEEDKYDIIFIDHDKPIYEEAYSIAKRRLKPGGMILADNVLWRGRIVDTKWSEDDSTTGVLDFNRTIMNDPEVESLIVPIGDGVSITILRQENESHNE